MTKQRNTIYRQGDVILIRMDGRAARGKELPREDGSVVLAHGEVTGHKHRIPSLHCSLYVDDSSPISEADSFTMVSRLGGGLIPDRLLKCDRGVELLHEEHAPIKLPRGTYRVRIQRTYEPQGVRNVQD
jgi:hypothetical protein